MSNNHICINDLTWNKFGVIWITEQFWELYLEQTSEIAVLVVPVTVKTVYSVTFLILMEIAKKYHLIFTISGGWY